MLAKFVVLIFVAYVVLFDGSLAKKTKERNTTDPKVVADTAFTAEVEKLLSPWFHIGFVENMTAEMCESMANGTTLSQIFSRYHTPWGLLPLIYPLADDEEITELNATIAALSESFSPYGALYAVDFAIANIEVMNDIFAPMEALIIKDMKKEELNAACADGINKAAKLITEAKVQKVINALKKNYTDTQCEAIYSALNPKMFNLDLYKFEKTDCTGSGPTMAHLVELNNDFNLTGVNMTVPPSTCS